MIRLRQASTQRRSSQLQSVAWGLDLVQALKGHAKRCDLHSNIFFKRLEAALFLMSATEDPDMLLFKLAQEVGIGPLPWSSPVAAIAWSYRIRPSLNAQMLVPETVQVRTKDRVVSIGDVSARVVDEDLRHAHEESRFDIGSWRNGLDVRVLYHISYQATFMEWGMTDGDMTRCWEAM
jgi:hypothetical protein